MRMLIFFGMLIGVLAAVNEATGLTATLVGLLFALIGGSLVGWHRGVAVADPQNAADRRLTPTQVKAVANGAGLIALGGLLGLLLGFGLRTIDLFYIRPNVPLTERERAIENLSKQLEGLISKGQTPSPFKGGEDALQHLLEEAIRNLNRPADVRPVPIVVKTQSASASELRLLAEKIANEAANRKDKEAEQLSGFSKAVYALADALEMLSTYVPAERDQLPQDIRDDMNRLLGPANKKN